MELHAAHHVPLSQSKIPESQPRRDGGRGVGGRGRGDRNGYRPRKRDTPMHESVKAKVFHTKIFSQVGRPFIPPPAPTETVRRLSTVAILDEKKGEGNIEESGIPSA